MDYLLLDPVRYVLICKLLVLPMAALEKRRASPGKYEVINDNECDKDNTGLEFDTSKRGWFICAISVLINTLLYGIVSRQGIHNLVSYRELHIAGLD